jgi:ornithine carbamoyltransferase
MIFERPSLRTRVSFETGMAQLGGHAMMLKAYPKESADIVFGEDPRDQAVVLSSMADIIMARTYSHSTIEKLAKYSTVPVINGMSDEAHPVQILTDLYTILEDKKKLEGANLTYLGEGSGNTVHDMVMGSAKMGVNFTLGCPKYEDPEVRSRLPSSFGYPSNKYWNWAKEDASKTGVKLSIEHDPVEAVKDADVVYTDSWIAYDIPEEKAREADIKSVFFPYQVNKELLRHARKDAIVMHCLPAHKGNEIAADVFDDPRARMYQQAENRLHVQKGIMVTLLGA